MYVSQQLLRMDGCPPNKTDNASATQFVIFFKKKNILSSHLLLNCIVFAKLENVHFLKGMEVLFLGPALMVDSVVSSRY